MNQKKDKKVQLASQKKFFLLTKIIRNTYTDYTQIKKAHKEGKPIDYEFEYVKDRKVSLILKAMAQGLNTELIERIANSSYTESMKLLKGIEKVKVIM